MARDFEGGVRRANSSRGLSLRSDMRWKDDQVRIREQVYV